MLQDQNVYDLILAKKKEEERERERLYNFK